ncbi:MAG: hypothetical protein EZS28_030062 [Streblomastix strix]|uniref:Uncharacterized protein n=1 Tax=Streblomastix strix TaxID=222440 RepID=A0A5J4UWE9_9EUKA|nr:MAG: hypothetical protein EZS28_030062 [Streblomastix strix]
MYGWIAPALILNADNVCKFLIVITAAKIFEFAFQSKSQNATMCDLGLLISFIAAQQEENGRKLMDLTIALSVAFIAARMTKLARMLIGLIGKFCPVKAMINWLKDDECIKVKQELVFLNPFLPKLPDVYIFQIGGGSRYGDD